METVHRTFCWALVGALTVTSVFAPPAVVSSHSAEPNSRGLVPTFTVSPLAGPSPLTVRIQGTVDFLIYVAEVKYSDGSSRTWHDYGRLFGPLNIDVTHEFTCPGAHTIEVVVFDGTLWSTDFTVLAMVPSAMDLAPLPGATAMSIKVQLANAVNIGRVARSVVDWGDGNPPEDFNWIPVGANYQTPPHTYSVVGNYLVTVSHYYVGEHCSFSHASSISIEVTDILDPVEHSTWGRIKSLFAR